MERGDEFFGCEYRSGETVFRQGDPGHTMYIIQAGSVEVSQRKDGREFMIAIRGKGDFFGEMALLQNDMRSTTATAISRTRLIPLTKDIVTDLLKRDPYMSFNLLRKLIQRIQRAHDRYRKKWREESAFRDTSVAYTRNALAFPVAATTDECRETLDEVTRFTENLFIACSAADMTYYRYDVEPGGIVFRKGDRGNNMFLVLSGTVGVSDGEIEDKKLIDTIGPGDFFGEMALIANIPRSATVTALEVTELIAIDKQRFIDSIQNKPELAIAVINALIARLAYLEKVIADPDCF